MASEDEELARAIALSLDVRSQDAQGQSSSAQMVGSVVCRDAHENTASLTQTEHHEQAATSARPQNPEVSSRWLPNMEAMQVQQLALEYVQSSLT